MVSTSITGPFGEPKTNKYRYAVVTGSGRILMDTNSKAKAEQFVKDWKAFTRGRFSKDYEKTHVVEKVHTTRRKYV